VTCTDAEKRSEELETLREAVDVAEAAGLELPSAVIAALLLLESVDES
jgi:hypothetical protein